MRKTILAAAAVASLLATPALAQSYEGFTGARASVGLTEGRNQDTGYVGSLGYDTSVTERTRLGVELNVRDVFEDGTEDFDASARYGYAIRPNILAFVKGGVARYEGEYGAQAGAGLEFDFSNRTFARVEYSHTDLNERDRDQGAVSFGVRF